jgi:hypothetical protein
MNDYSGFLVHAKAYLRQAEEAFVDKKYEQGLSFLKLCDNEVRQAIENIERIYVE